MDIAAHSADENSIAFLRMGAWSAVVLLIYCLLTMVVLVWLGAAPASAQGCFDLIQKNLVVALLRLDVLTILVMPVFCGLYSGLYVVLKRDVLFLASLSLGCTALGVALVLSNASVLSLIHLSNQYAVAGTDAQKALLLAAGEAVISNDMWHGTAATLGGILLQLGGIAVSLAMLRSHVFRALTAYLGIVVYTLDLGHLVIGFASAKVAIALIAVAGPLYIPWYAMVAVRLHKLERLSRRPGERTSAD